MADKTEVIVRLHGSAGYRIGCRCSRCRDGHRVKQNEYNARKRGEVVPPAPVSSPVAGDAPIGEIERLADALITVLDVVGAEADLLAAEALAAARVMDEARATWRPHLLGPAAKLLHECLDRLRAVSSPRPARLDVDDPDVFDVEALVASIGRQPVPPGQAHRYPG